MFCKNCGKEIADNATFCPNCGVSVTNAPVNAPVNAPAANVKRKAHGIALAAKVFIILGMIGGFWCILPLIFGGIALSKMSRGKPSAGISVCVLLFCNIIGGILLLCSDESNYI